MERCARTDKEPVILSPKPMRTSVVVLKTTVSNPFDENIQVQRSLSFGPESETVNTELCCILNSENNFPTSKSLPSPLFAKFSERPPTRHRVNPMIHDEQFKKIDSISTASDEM